MDENKRVKKYHYKQDSDGEFLEEIRLELFGADLDQMYVLEPTPWDANQIRCKLNCQKGYYISFTNINDENLWYEQKCFECSLNCKACKDAAFRCTECYEEEDVEEKLKDFRAKKVYTEEKINLRDKLKN